MRSIGIAGCVVFSIACMAFSALAEEDQTMDVRRADGRVWIAGMEDVDWGGSFFTREDSQVRCLVEALRCAGHGVDYAEVMGLSGAAFKLTMSPTLFVAEIHSEMGMDWTEIVHRIWGVSYDVNAISLNSEQNPDWREELLETARESIGRGMPLFYMNGEWNLLVGYHEEGSAFVCKAYAGGKPGYEDMKIPGGFVGEAWFASTLRVAGDQAPQRESVMRSLCDAVELATKPAEKDGQRRFGFAAYETWIEALEEDRKDVSTHGNAFSYSQLLTSRRAAAAYLRRVAEEMGGDAAGPLRAAADRYEAVAQRLDAGRDCVKHPWDESWTPENLAREASILRESLEDDRAAVGEIGKALRTLGEAH